MAMTVTAPAETRHSPFASNEVRYEGRAKVSGAAAYSADASRPGMLWAAFVSSPVAHARIARIDTQAARELPGVHAVLTGTDIGEHYLGRALFDWPVLATDVVRFIGQYVVAVAAETREGAQAAAQAVEVHYDELPAIFDPEEALADGAPLLHPNPERYPFIIPGKRRPVPHPNMQGYLSETQGEPEAAFAGAHRVFEHHFSTPRYFGAAIEPRATMVWIDERGIVHVISTNKSPFALRAQLAIATGLPAESIVVEPAYIGGDFGAKGLSVDEFVCYFLARETGRPIKAVRSYLDDMRSTNVRHAATVTLKTAVTADGMIAAMNGRVVFNGGAFGAGKPIPTILPAVRAIPAIPYRIPNADWEVMSVYTHTVPGGHVRAPGETQILFAVESHLDIIAHEMGIDPIAFRIANASEPRMVDVLERLRTESGWDRPPAPGRGRGMSGFERHVGSGKTNVKLIARPGGTIDIETGLADQGGGNLTAVQRVVSAKLGIPLERIRLVSQGHRRGRRGSRCGRQPRNAHRRQRDAGRAGRAERRSARRRLGRLGGRLARCRRCVGARVGDTAGIPRPLRQRRKPRGRACEQLCGVRRRSQRRSRNRRRRHRANHVRRRYRYDDQSGRPSRSSRRRLHVRLRSRDDRRAGRRGRQHREPVAGRLQAADACATSRPFAPVLLDDEAGPGPFGAKSAGELNTGGVGPAIANAVANACGVRLTQLPITSERVLNLLRAR